MKKVIENLKSVNLLGLFAILMVAFATLALRADSNVRLTEKWANDNGTWVNVDGQTQQPEPGQPGDYRCTLEEESPICTAEFPQGNDPNSNPSGMTNVINGFYSEL